MYPSPSSGGKMLSGVCESVDSNTLLPALSYLPVPYYISRVRVIAPMCDNAFPCV